MISQADMRTTSRSTKGNGTQWVIGSAESAHLLLREGEDRCYQVVGNTGTSALGSFGVFIDKWREYDKGIQLGYATCKV